MRPGRKVVAHPRVKHLKIGVIPDDPVVPVQRAIIDQGSDGRCGEGLCTGPDLKDCIAVNRVNGSDLLDAKALLVDHPVSGDYGNGHSRNDSVGKEVLDIRVEPVDRSLQSVRFLERGAVITEGGDPGVVNIGKELGIFAG